jgi:hypothetical protein
MAVRGKSCSSGRNLPNLARTITFHDFRVVAFERMPGDSWRLADRLTAHSHRFVVAICFSRENLLQSEKLELPSPPPKLEHVAIPGSVVAFCNS